MCGRASIADPVTGTKLDERLQKNEKHTFNNVEYRYSTYLVISCKEAWARTHDDSTTHTMSHKLCLCTLRRCFCSNTGHLRRKKALC